MGVTRLRVTATKETVTELNLPIDAHSSSSKNSIWKEKKKKHIWVRYQTIQFEHPSSSNTQNYLSDRLLNLLI